MKRVLIFAAALTVIMIACHKNDSPQDCLPDLPCATQYGANTFGCYIDGKPWVAEIGLDILDPTVHKLQAWFDEPEYGSSNLKFLQVKAASIDSGKYERFNISFRPITDIGVIEHKSLERFITEVNLEGNQQIKGGVYYIDTLSPYKMKIITINREKNIVAGQFSFIALSENKEDTIKVTEGRFDVIYNPE